MAVVIFKAVEKCNSNCIYCNVIKKNQDAIMSAALLETVFKRIDEYLQTYPDRHIDLTWHGGEVCLLGADYFKRAFEFQERLCPETKSRINHLVQSNLTLINQEILDIFKLMGIDQIGSSFEPIPHIRGFGKDRDSEAYNKRFFDGINLLEENGFRWGVIYVVHRKSLEMPLDIFHYLTNLNLANGPNFNPVVLFGEDANNLAITPREFAEFLGAILPVWWENRERYTVVKPFTDFLSCLRDHDMKLLCGNCGNCANHWVYIDPDGKSSHCGIAGEFNFIDYGNIRERSLDDILMDPKRECFKERQAWLPQADCRDCRLWKICHGGCPMETVGKYGDMMHSSPYCETLKIFIEQYFEPITGLKADFRPTREDFALSGTGS